MKKPNREWEATLTVLNGQWQELLGPKEAASKAFDERIHVVVREVQGWPAAKPAKKPAKKGAKK